MSRRIGFGTAQDTIGFTHGRRDRNQVVARRDPVLMVPPSFGRRGERGELLVA